MQTPLCFHYLVEKTDYIWRKVVNDCWKEKGKKSIPTVSKEQSKSKKQMSIQDSQPQESTWGESQSVNPRDTNPIEWEIQDDHIVKNLLK